MPRTQGHTATRSRSGHRSEPADDDTERPDEGRSTGGSRGGKGGAGAPVKSSHVIEEHIDVGVPRDVAYDQWTRYDELSKYTKNESAQAKRSDRVGFRSKIGPLTRTWDAEIVEQVPGRRIAWRSIGGAKHMGVVTFHSLDDRLTRIMVQMEYHPTGVLETIGNFLRMQRRRVRKDLRLFKNFVELQGEATGKGADEKRSGPGLRQETDERLGGSGSGNGSESERSGHDEAAGTKRKAS